MAEQAKMAELIRRIEKLEEQVKELEDRRQVRNPKPKRKPAGRSR